MLFFIDATASTLAAGSRILVDLHNSTVEHAPSPIRTPMPVSGPGYDSDSAGTRALCHSTPHRPGSNRPPSLRQLVLTNVHTSTGSEFKEDPGQGTMTQVQYK
jgi:hypothetical protein